MHRIQLEFSVSYTSSSVGGKEDYNTNSFNDTISSIIFNSECDEYDGIPTSLFHVALRDREHVYYSFQAATKLSTCA